MGKVRREDLVPDESPPRSLRQLVVEQLDYVQRDGEFVPVDSVDELLTRIYKHIEAEAIKRFKSNQLWAVKAWVYENILEDSVAKEAAVTDETLLDELVSPIADWQKGEFDPIANLRQKLELGERKPGYIKECVRVATRLVAKYGKKQSYSEMELMEFLGEEHKRYRRSSYVTRVRQLKTVLDSLPEDERGRRPKLPIARIPAYPPLEEFQRPFFTNEEIDKLIYWAVLEARPDVVLRLVIASIYGTRVGELAQLSSEHINLDDGTPTISIPTEKKGRRAPQPIPNELVPLFSIPLSPTKPYLIQRHLKSLCKKAGVRLQHRLGIHAIRRSVATALLGNDDLKDLWVYRFLRWAEASTGLGVMPRYIRTPVSETDAKVIGRHPYVAMWKDMIEFLPYLPQYAYVCNMFKIMQS